MTITSDGSVNYRPPFHPYHVYDAENDTLTELNDWVNVLGFDTVYAGGQNFNQDGDDITTFQDIYPPLAIEDGQYLVYLGNITVQPFDEVDFNATFGVIVLE